MWRMLITRDRSTWPVGAALVVAACVAFGTHCGGASAQPVLRAPSESYGSSTPANIAPSPRPMPSYRWRPAPQSVDDLPGTEKDLPGADEDPAGGGPYQTMCVRACDGFYFPIRQNALLQTFPKDEKSCTAACGPAARLFYFPVNGGTPDTMIDLSGRKYTDEPHAFAYRKAIVPGCTCKPAPWSAEAAAKHQSYAATEVEARVKAETESQDGAPTGDEKASALISEEAARRYYDSDASSQNSAGNSSRNSARRDGLGPQANSADQKAETGLMLARRRPMWQRRTLKYNNW